MEQETKDILNQIASVLRKGDNASIELWDVLTALRGPDSECYTEDANKIKEATTAIIRYYILRRVKSVETKLGIVCNTDNRVRAILRAGMNISDHFSAHAWAAFQVLGLKWDKVNKRK